MRFSHVPWKTSFAKRSAFAVSLDMKLYRFRYSPFARKVQMVLDLLRPPYELIEVPYDDRE